MSIGALDIRLLDIIDVLVVAYLMYMVYKLVRGTLAFNIFIGAVMLYVVFLVVETFEMRLLSLLLGSVVAFGVIILIIIFQPEVREFLLVLGNTTLRGRLKFLDTIFRPDNELSAEKLAGLNAIQLAVTNLSKSKTGALMVFSDTALSEYQDSGTKVDAKISASLIENLFFKNSPLHDGAMVLNGDRILSTSCILPVSKNKELSKDLGLRHRAAVGVSEKTNALALVISEESGEISTALKGEIRRNVPANKVAEIVSAHLYVNS